MVESTAFAIAIQAGGQSSRMGQDKALMPFLGRPLIARVIERLYGLAGEVLITTNCPEAYAYFGLPVVSDLLPGVGPLGGLYTALSAARAPVVAVVGCDMPFIVPALITAERDFLQNNPVDAVVPRSPNGIEPLLAVYRRGACLTAVRTALDAGERKMTSWYPSVRVHEMAEETVALFDPQFLSFVNVNTAEDFKLAESLAQKQGNS